MRVGYRKSLPLIKTRRRPAWYQTLFLTLNSILTEFLGTAKDWRGEICHFHLLHYFYMRKPGLKPFIKSPEPKCIMLSQFPDGFGNVSGDKK